jgi:nucleotide-binding universal stress UspA family protein
MVKEFERIIVPLDGSEEAKKAAEKALAIAEGLDVPVVALHVIHIPGLPSLYAYPDEIPEQDLQDIIRKEAQTYLNEIEHLGKKVGVTVSTKIVEGHPANEIIKEAQRDDLIVIGSKGRTALDRILLGSVAENVARHASSAVMIVR